MDSSLVVFRKRPMPDTGVVFVDPTLIPSPLVSPGLIHRWPMNDANVSGTTIIDVVGGLNGTAGSGVTSSVGPFTQSRAISDDANGYITLPNGLVDFTADFTVGCWALRSSYNATFDSSGGSPRLFNFNNLGATDYIDGAMLIAGVSVYPAGSMGMSNTAGDVSGCSQEAQLFASTWMHIVFACRSSVIEIYANAKRVNGGGNDHLGTTGTESYIGTRAIGARPWGGSLYQFVVYNYALSSVEVTALYNAQ